MATYKVIVDNWDSGLNELLSHQEKRYDARTKRMRVYNTEKAKNEKLLRLCIQKAGLNHKNKLKTPVNIHYHIYAKNRKHDKMNLGSCIDKCFCDALQELKVISNDGWSEIGNVTFEFDVDKNMPRAEITIIESEE